MKIKITSLLLAFSLLLSLFTVFSFAVESDSNANNPTYTSLRVHYKNSFGDNEDDMGGNLALNNASATTFEVKEEANGNNYGYYNFNDPTKNVFMQLSPSESANIGPHMLGYMIFEFDFNDFGNAVTTSKFLDINSGKGSFAPAGGRVAAPDILNVANDNNGNYFYFNGNKNDKIYITSNTWNHIRCELSVLSTDATKYQVKCYIGNQTLEGSFDLGDPAIIYEIRFGSTKSTNQRFGLDNIVLYTTPDNKISAPNAGILAMKVGAENARYNNRQIELESVPLLINGQIYCPVDIIEQFTGKACVSEYVVILDNSRYIHIDNVQAALGVSAKSFDMGLIVVGNCDIYVDDNSSYADIATFMKTFVFNLPTADQLISDVEATTNNFDHPYLLVDADRFTQLRNLYNTGRTSNSEEAALYDYIKRYIDSAKSTYKTYCGTDVTASYSGIVSSKIPKNNNYNTYNNNGYDNGGRVSIDTKPLLYFAFAYQITGNMNYARAAYDFMIYLGEWNHWGPDHFLNCADTAYPFAIAYDWLYDAFVQLNSNGEKAKSNSQVYDKSKLATILFTHVIIPGYVQSNNLTCPWPGTAGSRYATKTSNWNAVCTSGVVMAALMLLNEDVSTGGMVFNTQKKSGSTFTQTTTPIESIGNTSIHAGLSTYSDYAAKLVSMNLGTLAKYGLDQYYPDGSYIESPGYWSYGTNSLFRLIASLLSATGDDYGFMDAWGIDTTCYFAIHSESSDYKMWNFNDGSDGMQDSSLFFFVGSYYEDDNLIRVRKKQLTSGKTYSLYDILFYDTTVTGEPELTTEYQMLGIDAFSVRSSWDKGSIYAGIIGGPNTVSHGQMDAGSFIYHNKGKVWFTDLGTDNYNMSGGYFSNFNLYRVGAEGHNMLLISSEQGTLPYGQSKNADPKITKSHSGFDGGYAVLDMSDSYGSHVISGQRGLLFTNSRSTVVIQDEYVFNGAKTAYWFGHYQLATGYVEDVVISSDGRTAFMISGDDIIRVSIVSDNTNLKFEIMDAYTYVLSTTKRTDRTQMGQATTEYSRDSYRKLAIKCENVTELNLAVVIEEVNGYEIGSSYDFLSMDEWVSGSGSNSIIEEKFKADFEKNTSVIGSYLLKSELGSVQLNAVDTDTLSYMQLLSGGYAGAKDSLLTLYPRNSTPIKLTYSKYVTFDFDIHTDGSFIDNSTIGINAVLSDGTTKFIPLITLVDNKLVANGVEIAVGSTFKHITLIISTANKCVYVYADDTLVAKLNSTIDSTCQAISSVEFKLSKASEYSGIFLDNLVLRTISAGYDDTVLSSILSSGGTLSTWNDRILFEAANNPVATDSTGTVINTVSELENAIANGSNISILRNIGSVVNVTSAVAVNTNGYVFKYASSNYLARSNGDYLIFETGSIKVKWHIGDTVFEQSYTASQVAVFNGSSDKIGKLTYTKIETEDGTVYKFYETGWANTPGGNALAPSDMVVSKDNCEFWLVSNVPIDCMFVKLDSNGQITRYYNVQKLAELFRTAGNYNIVLCQDVELADVNLISVAADGKTLNLNGYTLSHTTVDAHLFNYNNGSQGNFNIVGPGTIKAENTRTIFTSSSNTADTTSNYGFVAKNVNFVTNGQMADLRVGQHKFINCNISQSSTTKPLIALWNKNPSTDNYSNPKNLLTVTFEGSTVTAYALVSYSAESYSEVYVKNSAISAQVYLWESGNTLVKFSVSENSSLISPKLAKDMTIKYTGASFANGTLTNMEIPATYLKNGTVLTNNYDTALPYRVSNNYATLVWKDKDGNVLLTEHVAVGVTPKLTNAKIAEYLSAGGKGYTYELMAVSSTGQVVLTPVLKDTSPMLISMAIENDLTMYFYIAKSEMDTVVKSVRVNGILITLSSYELVTVGNVEYYRYSIIEFTPAKASDNIHIAIEYSNGSTKTVDTSAVNYLEEVLALSTSDSEKTLAVKLLRYIQNAQIYFGSTNSFEIDKISQILDQYKEYDVIFGGMSEERPAIGALRGSIRSACFNLSASVRIRFYLATNYTGRISITFNGTTTYYDVSSGKCSGNDYIEVIMPAATINDTLTLSDGTNTVNYGLSAYSTTLNNTDKALDNLLSSISEYSAAAKNYIGK